MSLSPLPPSLKEHGVIKETARPPACRPLRTETEGKVCDGREPRAQRHKMQVAMSLLCTERMQELSFKMSARKMLKCSQFRRSYRLCKSMCVRVCAQSNSTAASQKQPHKDPVRALKISQPVFFLFLQFIPHPFLCLFLKV